MKWKKVFFAGGLLVLAACGTSTAPTSPSALNTLDRAAVSSVDSSTVQTVPVLPAPPTGVGSECSNMVIRVGETDVPVVICTPTVAW